MRRPPTSDLDAAREQLARRERLDRHAAAAQRMAARTAPAPVVSPMGETPTASTRRGPRRRDVYTGAGCRFDGYVDALHAAIYGRRVGVR